MSHSGCSSMGERHDPSAWTDFAAGEVPTAIIGRELRFFPSVGSTNDMLKQAARQGAAEGLVFVADEQTAGRGRRGRSWTAPPGTSLLVSALLRPIWLAPREAFVLTMLASVAAAEALESTGLPIDLKWPNDLHVAGRKLGGILVETELNEERLAWTVIGCGINVNWEPTAIPELGESATSLSRELGQPLARRPLLLALLTALDTHYLELRRGAHSALFTAWRSRLKTIGQQVRADTPQGILHGLAEDVTSEGSLIIRDASGVRHTVTAGDVSLRPATAS